jgi:hypothetical protein
MEVGRRKKEEAVIAMVSAVKNVLTVLAVAISWGVLGLDPRPSIYCVPCSGCQKTLFIYI